MNEQVKSTALSDIEIERLTDQLGRLENDIFDIQDSTVSITLNDVDIRYLAVGLIERGWKI